MQIRPIRFKQIQIGVRKWILKIQNWFYCRIKKLKTNRVKYYEANLRLKSYPNARIILITFNKYAVKSGNNLFKKWFFTIIFNTDTLSYNVINKAKQNSKA